MSIIFSEFVKCHLVSFCTTLYNSVADYDRLPECLTFIKIIINS